MSTTDEPEPPERGLTTRRRRRRRRRETGDRKKRRAKAADAGTKPEPGPEPFAHYPARLYCVDKGYQPGTSPEAAALADVRNLGAHVRRRHVVRDPLHHRRRARSRAPLRISTRARDRDRPRLPRVHRIMNATKLPVGIRIVEDPRRDHRRPTSSGSRAIAAGPGLKKVAINGFALSPSTARSGRRSSWLARGALASPRAHRRPRRTAAELGAPAPAIAESEGPPWLTCGILGVLALVFVVELVAGARQAPASSPRH